MVFIWIGVRHRGGGARKNVRNIFWVDGDGGISSGDGDVGVWIIFLGVSSCGGGLARSLQVLASAPNFIV